MREKKRGVVDCRKYINYMIYILSFRFSISFVINSGKERDKKRRNREGEKGGGVPFWAGEISIQRDTGPYQMAAYLGRKKTLVRALKNRLQSNRSCALREETEFGLVYPHYVSCLKNNALPRLSLSSGSCMGKHGWLSRNGSFTKRILASVVLATHIQTTGCQ